MDSGQLFLVACSFALVCGQAAPECNSTKPGIVLKAGATGTLDFPLGTEDYKPNLRCYWRIVGPKNSILRYRFTQFDFEPVDYYLYDYIRIFKTTDDFYQNKNPAYEYSGDDLPKGGAWFETSANELFVVFKSDQNVEGKGFTLEWVTPVNGGFSAWSPWSGCSVSCGTGFETRSRCCSNPHPQNGGAYCKGLAEEKKECKEKDCKSGVVDGFWAAWTAWGACSKTCGEGTKTRTRTCSNPAPSGGGRTCPGLASESATCKNADCSSNDRVDGGWTDWCNWSDCTKSCGGGTRTSSRTCTNPVPSNGGSSCTGDSLKTEMCNGKSCGGIDGGWTEWCNWSDCTKSCGGGTRTSSRSCTNPVPSNGGKYCNGETTKNENCNEQSCGADGNWSPWSGWSACSRTCGDGTKTATRTCSNPAPSGGGRDCAGSSSKSVACKDKECMKDPPVDGGWTEWCNWSDCTKSCGGGTRTSSRACTNPVPENGGSQCVGDDERSQACNTQACQENVDGNWSNWSPWSDCSVSCGSGQTSRSRTCTNPAPSPGGQYCNGNARESKTCTKQRCDNPVDGGWSGWTAYSSCTKPCGGGTQTKSRRCDNPTPTAGGQYCNGDSTDTRSCNEDDCKVAGGWSSWCSWSSCSVTCGEGVRTTSRTCDNPVPQDGGQYCPGQHQKTQPCTEKSCSADGNWSPWSAWTRCSKTCGDGTASRTRSCTNPAPSNGGRYCRGDDRQSTGCNEQDCPRTPVDGDWSSWARWSGCSRSCGGGTRTSSRRCDDPAPRDGGKYCTGDDTRSNVCNEGQCAVDGDWSSWTSWSGCSRICGDGTKTSSRRCDSPPPSNGGRQCSGEATKSKYCNEGSCSVDGGWSTWTRWSGCSTTCGDGTRASSRTCDSPTPSNGGKYCTGNDLKTKQCNQGSCEVDGGWSDWSSWSGCSASCGRGTQTSSRRCDDPVPSAGGRSCSGPRTKSKECDEGSCPVDGGWSSWSAWDSCSKTCGRGTQLSSRKCDNPNPRNGGQYCNGDYTKSKDCDRGLCPVDGAWSDWTGWGGCSATCGEGTRSSSRRCDNPAPRDGGDDCEGQRTKTRDCDNGPCAVDGGWSRWSHWGSCSKTCGMTGTRTRSRTCTEPVPQNGGRYCSGNAEDSGTCNEGDCPAAPVDGGWSSWDPWSRCSKTCGGGTQTTRKYCDNPTPKNDGAYCQGDDRKTQSCNDSPCPVNGAWSDWAPWSGCSKTCGSGSQTTTRRCDNPRPQYGGEECRGESSRSQRCNRQTCAVDGEWGSWSNWGACSKTCGGGTQTTSRDCDDPAPKHGGQYCQGEHKKTRDCNEQPCQVDGGWSSWTPWTTCSETCGDGTQTKSRRCDNPVPQNGGASCQGDRTRTKDCNERSCAVDGNWSQWSGWTACSATCGTGTQTDSRTCDDPVPRNGGRYCSGQKTRSKDCDAGRCPIDGEWSGWSTWTSCSKTCGRGSRISSRKCDNPSPSDGGAYCYGDCTKTKECDEGPCPVDGEWSSWSGWTGCTKTCGGGTQTTQRACDDPTPRNGGQDCQGEKTMSRQCNSQPCAVDGGWSRWSHWGSCSKTCGMTGTRTRSRTCTEPEPKNGGRDCGGESRDSGDCNEGACPNVPVDGGWSEWDTWSACPRTCGGAIRTTRRYCDNPTPKHGGKSCVGDDRRSDSCADTPCPVDGAWSDWASWTTCSKTCGGGSQTTSRRCDNPRPQYGGEDCFGDVIKSQRCNTQTCAIDGEWSSWISWSGCSKTCGGGIQRTTRSCDDPAPQNGGAYCKGDQAMTRDCNEQPCKVDGNWSSWSRWGSCSRTCGDGTKSRSRTCTDPAPSNGGDDCSGDNKDLEPCYEKGCPVDGEWSAWSGWTSCSETCGEGTKTSSRTCDRPEPRNGGAECAGDRTRSTACNERPCAVDGEWSQWSAWNTCTKTCGLGLRTSSRTCDDPAPSDGGQYCSGQHTKTKECDQGPCPVNGEWSSWNRWAGCSKTCGAGTQTTTRSCDNPAPRDGGEECEGERTKTRSCKNEPCPVDGEWSRWSHWGSCSKTCGMTGTRTRSRTCTEPEPKNGGRDCGGEDSDTGDCNEGPCPDVPVDGGWSSWDPWSGCSKTCGDGTKTTKRFCDNPTPKFGGEQCTGDADKTEPCYDLPCPVDGAWSNWDSWTACSKTCGGGSQTTSRRCDNPRPQYGGEECQGDSRKSQRCSTQKCEVDGGWSSWNNWSICSKTCGGGTKSSSRECDNPTPKNGGSYCKGDHMKMQDCNKEPCAVNGNWSPWSRWGSCSVTCGDGSRTRARTCTDPAPSDGGDYCSGSDENEERCNERECAVDGGWSSWSPWTGCSKTCGEGTKTSSRTCDHPEPKNGGASCVGDSTRTNDCNEGPCAVNGEWSPWSAWTSCSRTCGRGSRTSSRKCDNPSPSNGGEYCSDEPTKTKECDQGPCPVDGEWSSWSRWNGCTKTCGGGTDTRSRACDNPSPRNGGEDCEGERSTSRKCNDQPCPVDGGWSRWSHWGSCSKTCGMTGTRTRSRTCTEPEPKNGGQYCDGDSRDSGDCNEGPCPNVPVDGGWSAWDTWSRCSQTCGEGTQTTQRYCDNPTPKHGGKKCTGDDRNTQSCNESPCAVNGAWSDWAPWSGCSKTCGGGSQTTTRRCDSPRPQYGGEDCLGDASKNQKCKTQRCGVDGEWSGWSNWNGCSKTCGGGFQTITRSCDEPAPQHGGDYCDGEPMMKRNCNEQPCQVDGNWSPWSRWTSCSRSCGDGTKSRTRSCTDPAPMNGGRSCSGNDEESSECYERDCPAAPVDGNWSPWSKWSGCSKTCGDGTSSRTRTCTDPAPANGGQSCRGDNYGTRDCNERDCSVDGNWSSWSRWTSCSRSCGDGTKSRTRSCTDPAPMNGGRSCSGNGEESSECYERDCPAAPVDGKWSSWSRWSGCSQSCDFGTTSRTRTCTDPAPSNGGQSCPGDDEQTNRCFSRACPVDGNWSSWSTWTDCSKTCGDGTKSRTKACTDPAPTDGGRSCSGTGREDVECNKRDCPKLDEKCATYIGKPCSTSNDCAGLRNVKCSSSTCQCDEQNGYYHDKARKQCLKIQFGSRCVDDAFCASGMDGSYCPAGICTCRPGQLAVFYGLEKPKCVVPKSEPKCSTCIETGGVCYDADGNGFVDTCGCSDCAKPTNELDTLASGCDDYFALAGQSCNIDGSIKCLNPSTTECAFDGQLSMMSTCTCKIGYVMVPNPDDPDKKVCARSITKEMDPDCGTCVGNGGRCYDLDNNDEMDGCLCPVTRSSPCPGPEFACTKNHVTVDCSSKDITICVTDKDDFIGDLKALYAEGYEETLDCYFDEVETNRWCLTLDYITKRCGLEVTDARHSISYAAWVMFQHKSRVVSPRDLCLYGYCTYHKLAKTSSGLIEIDMKKITTGMGRSVRPSVEMDIYDKWNQDVQVVGAKLGDFVKLNIKISDDKGVYRALRAEVCLASSMMSLDHPNVKTSILIQDGCPVLNNEFVQPSPIFTSIESPRSIMSNYFPVPTFDTDVTFFHCAVKVCITEQNCKPKTCDTLSRSKRYDPAVPGTELLKELEDAPDAVTKTVAVFIVGGQPVVVSETSPDGKTRTVEKVMEHIINTGQKGSGQPEPAQSNAVLIASIVGTSLLGIVVIAVVVVIFMTKRQATKDPC